HLTAAADVGHGVNDAAVEQAQAVGIERRRHRGAVGAVAVQQQWGFAVFLQALLVDERDRDLRAVGGGGGNTFGGIARGVVAAHLGLLEQLALPIVHVVVVDRVGRHERLVAVAQRR